MYARWSMLDGLCPNEGMLNHALERTYHVDNKDYDCRPKWMAIAALARQESPEAVPLLISLVDHWLCNLIGFGERVLPAPVAALGSLGDSASQH